MIRGGFFLFARQMIESDIFKKKPDKWLKIWLYILATVNHKDLPDFPRGKQFFTYNQIMYNTGATPDQVKHCLEFLKMRHSIATQKATRGMVIEVINYNKYQNKDNYKSHTENQSDARQKPDKSHTINNNDNKENKDNKEKYNKEKYLDFVLLTKEEYQKLIEKFGKSEADDRIDRLNTYIGSKGVKYKSHYYTILNWARKDKPASQEEGHKW